MKKIYDQYNSGDKEAAMETQRLILKIRKITKLGTTIPIIHYILRMKGIDSCYPRRLYINIDSILEINIQKELEKLDLN
jgi:dihydrodipicolinate synthase/N-acetylneuraminate lyase